MSAVFANRLGKKAIAILTMLGGVGRREGPILPLGREFIGRRTDPASGDEEIAVRPEVAPETVGGEGEIVIEADGKAALASALLRRAKLHIDLPLHVLVEQNTLRMSAREFTYGARIRVAVMLRPVGPDPQIGIAAVKKFVERAVGGELHEQIAFATAELGELLGTRARIVEKLNEAPLQEAQF